MAGRNNGKSLIGEVKGKVELILSEVLPRIEVKISSIETGLNNHLAHHERNKESRGERWFKIGMIVVQAVLTAMLGYLLTRLH